MADFLQFFVFLGVVISAFYILSAAMETDQAKKIFDRLFFGMEYDISWFSPMKSLAAIAETVRNGIDRLLD